MKFKFSQRQIYDHFGAVYAARGDVYERTDRVVEARFDNKTREISGWVQGTKKEPYKVKIIISIDGKSIEITDCSCPMGGLCKHSAALLFRALRADDLTLVDDYQRAKEDREAMDRLSPPLQVWLAGIKKELAQSSDETAHSSAPPDFLVYLLDITKTKHLALSVVHAAGQVSDWRTIKLVKIDRVARGADPFIAPEDSFLANMFCSASPPLDESMRQQFPSDPEISKLLLTRLLETGRCCLAGKSSQTLKLGPEKKGSLSWKPVEDCAQSLVVQSAEPDDVVCIAGTAWYINKEKTVIGPLHLPVPEILLPFVFSAPRLEAEDASVLADELGRLGHSVPLPATDFKTTIVYVKPKPVLTLSTLKTRSIWAAGKQAAPEPLALLRFDYDRFQFRLGGQDEVKTIEGDEILIRRKDKAAEEEYVRELEAAGLVDMRSTPTDAYQAIFKNQKREAKSDWLRFSSDLVPTLTDRGWKVVYDKTYPYEVVTPQDDEWTAEGLNAEDGSSAWFSLDIGINVGGKRQRLLPILQAALRDLNRNNPLGDLESLNVNGVFYAPYKGHYIALPFDRVKDIVTVLLELFDKDNLKTIPVTIPQLLQLEDCGAGILWDRRLKRLLSKVKSFNGLQAVSVPDWFRAELRPYQAEALSWMDFLREFKLGGILADDMGLGKTVQTLAHIAVEKSANRAKKPYLVICPTSVLPNWLSEIEKFVPRLRTLSIHGQNRASSFSKLSDADIIVTTYPLLVRDIASWKNKSFTAVILDEAQAIKNPRTQVAQAVSMLKSEYRLCLTGTPVENSLEDIWAQFNFLSRGLLGDPSTFNRKYRNPIEKGKNALVQKLLQTKLKPFLLRRTKDVVAKDLPEKTVIINRVELDGAQRDLYETVRLAMLARVKETIESKGLARSHIEILDALLKLRQACCDPRLLSLESARGIDTSVKLDLLLEMLEELVSEGKKILLFSQFTSMLDLIIPELVARQIRFVEIRGNTKDRATPVKEFQEGRVPLFLLSLRAGGTGLNLTAADTVIHYDPWWNPSVENQATDRAHRIGQKKSVFVFKLITAGTIEEKILELQAKKSALAAGLLNSEGSLPTELTAADLVALFS